MTNKFAALLLCMAVSLPLYAANKAEKRVADSTAVLQAVLDKNEIPKGVLGKSICVLIYPSVKKVGIGLGMSYGRGLLVCRSGSAMNGKWGAPAMYTLDTGSLGAQLGGTATDYVLLIMNTEAANKALSGKLKLGADASAVAGPAGASAGTYDEKADVLTYSRAKGLFAGATLGTASMGSDNDANKELYGKDVTAAQIIRDGAVQTPASAKPLDDMLNKF